MAPVLVSTLVLTASSLVKAEDLVRLSNFFGVDAHEPNVVEEAFISTLAPLLEQSTLLTQTCTFATHSRSTRYRRPRCPSVDRTWIGPF